MPASGSRPLPGFIPACPAAAPDRWRPAPGRPRNRCHWACTPARGCEKAPARSSPTRRPHGCKCLLVAERAQAGLHHRHCQFPCPVIEFFQTQPEAVQVEVGVHPRPPKLAVQRVRQPLSVHGAEVLEQRIRRRHRRRRSALLGAEREEPGDDGPIRRDPAERRPLEQRQPIDDRRTGDRRMASPVLVRIEIGEPLRSRMVEWEKVITERRHGSSCHLGRRIEPMAVEHGHSDSVARIRPC